MDKISEEDREQIKHIVKEKLKNITTVLELALEDLFKKRMGFVLVLNEQKEAGDFTAYITNIATNDQQLKCLKKAIEMAEDPKTSMSNDGFSHSIN